MTRDVLNHLRDFEENLKDWETYLREIPLAVFLGDRGSRHKILHAVLVALQAAIDIANHWVSELTPQRPETYKSIVGLLREEKAVPASLAEDLEGLFSLRNVLIHRYQKLDLKKLYRHLEEGIGPLKALLKLSRSKVKAR